jgi:hypothetical protein
MAQLNFTITVPDAAVPRIMAAMRGHWGQVEDPPGSGTFREMTNAELQERFRKMMIDTLRNMVLNREVYEATETVKADVSGVSIT